MGEWVAGSGQADHKNKPSQLPASARVGAWLSLTILIVSLSPLFTLLFVLSKCWNILSINIFQRTWQKQQDQQQLLLQLPEPKNQQQQQQPAQEQQEEEEQQQQQQKKQHQLIMVDFLDALRAINLILCNSYENC